LLTFALHVHLFHHVKGPAFDYVGVALACFASWAGLPGPGESLLLAAAIFAAKHKLDISPLLLVAFFGATVGGIVGWLFGWFGGRSLLIAPGPLRSFRLDAAARGEQAFKRLEVVAILLTPSWVAGIYRAGPVVYNVVNATSAVVWTLAIGIGGYFAGPPVLEWISDYGTVGTVVAIVVVVVAVGGALLHRWRATIKRQAQRDPEPQPERDPAPQAKRDPTPHPKPGRARP
jgi:membrane protein DedA with SNARE-associated domain